jgi:DNA-binding transcriptional regulator WhiA
VVAKNAIMAIMRKSWNKGHTKQSHPSVKKISETMKKKGLDNFKEWREKMRKEGRIPTHYPALKKDENLAELLGVILGDGHIEKFPRTECLRLVSKASRRGFVDYYSNVIEKVFHKKPSIYLRKNTRAVDIRIYEKQISNRLGIPTGSKRNLLYEIPKWILNNEEYIIRFLRGLYEAEGSFSTHKPTYTYKFIFSNKNDSLLNIVEKLLTKLGFHPHVSKYKVQISRKDEVYEFKSLIEFRKY